jgi:aldehyde dehydrogenase (NAD+)
LNRNEIYVGGQWVPSGSDQPMLEVIDPTTETVLGAVPNGTADDVARAAEAARAAFDEWSQVPPAERAEWLVRIADGVEARSEEFAELVARELGMPLAQSKTIQVGLALSDLRTMPEAVAAIEWQEEVGHSLVLREPLGVVGAITPWNYPLHQITAKVGAALAAGCTIVVKPSEVAPLSAYLLTDVIDAVGLPAGVFNLVSGTGDPVGEALVTHPDVDVVSFTGSTRAGSRISELAAASVKPVTLELGGKSASIVLDDADLKTAVEGTLTKCYQNSGQTCSALTRLLVPRSRLADAERFVAEASAQYTVGNPLEEGTRLGPLVSAAQLRRVQDYIRLGIEEGARLVCGGLESPADRGYFVAPTVFSDVWPEMRIAREEIFGPVLVILPYDTVDDAVRIANDSDYGLAGAVWAADREGAVKVAQRIRTGQISINGGPFNPRAPFGGFKLSGHGRELGRYGVEEFLTYKSMQL